MTQTKYAETCNWLLQAQHAFRHGNPALGTSCLVKAEQTIPEIEDCLQFLACQTSADRIWRDWMIQGGLEQTQEFRVHNNWQVA